MKIYILCPANFATGGPEALHQLARQLLDLKYNTYIYYVNFDNTINTTPIHSNYLKYNVPYVVEIENNSNNYLLFPETFCTFLWDKNYSQLNKIIWWLSVTNFIISEKAVKNYYKNNIKKYFIKKYFKNYPIPSIKNIKKYKLLHIAHSYFSFDFLKSNGIEVIGQISDYMNSSFLEGRDYTNIKEDIIIYNPIKNKDFLEKIIQKTPHLNWIPIQNMTPTQVSHLMAKSKVYIDFGYHPGKERMPREACLMDCCLIIGKDGSAKYKQDMPILDEYHFEKKDNQITNIITKLEECLENYSNHIKNFSDYKKVLLNEKNKFQSDVSSVFNKIEKHIN